MGVRNLNSSDIEFEQDGRIEFDEASHTYSIPGLGNLTPVSTVIAKFFKPFDAFRISLRKCFNDPDKAARLRDEWACKGAFAAQAGTYLHSCIENFINDGCQPGKLACKVSFSGPTMQSSMVVDISREWRHFERFKEAVEFTPFRTEWRVFDCDAMVAGTIDLLCSCSDGTYEIYDWKRSDKIDRFPSRIFDKGINGLEHLPDTTYMHYCLQQNLYRYIVEKNYGLRISRMNLVVLHPNLSSYQIVPVGRLDREVEMIMNRLSAGK